MRELIEYPLVHPEVYAHLGIEPVRMTRCSCVVYHGGGLEWGCIFKYRAGVS